MEDGIYLIDKPDGITSYDVIRHIKKQCGVKKKIGHAGTLDPAASGLLVVAVGKATKELSYLSGVDKTYEAGILLGERTDTGDRDGVIVESRDLNERDITKNELQTVAGSLKGSWSLPVPAYSAVKVRGKPLYSYAREGKLDTIDIPLKIMRVDRFKLSSVDYISENRVLLETEMDVGSGTYVRAIAEEMGRRCSLPARLASLRRTRVGRYYVTDALSLKEIC